VPMVMYATRGIIEGENERCDFTPKRQVTNIPIGARLSH
jgi:hypothetical protein